MRLTGPASGLCSKTCQPLSCSQTRISSALYDAPAPEAIINSPANNAANAGCVWFSRRRRSGHPPGIGQQRPCIRRNDDRWSPGGCGPSHPRCADIKTVSRRRRSGIGRQWPWVRRNDDRSRTGGLRSLAAAARRHHTVFTAPTEQTPPWPHFS